MYQDLRDKWYFQKGGVCTSHHLCKYIYYTDSEKGRAATRVVKMSAEKTVIHNPHPGTNTKVSKNKRKQNKLLKKRMPGAPSCLFL